jgi:iron complex outermembrane receptor protein
LKQVVAHTYEVGLKSPAAARGLAWSLSLFRTDSDNDIIALASVIQGRGYYTNVPLTRRQGLEADVSYKSEKWSAYAAYSYIDATYRFAGDLSSPDNPSSDDNGNVHVTPGDRIGGIPPQRLKLGLDYTPVKTLTVGATVVAVSSQYYVGDEANQNPKLPGYAVLNLDGTYRFTKGIELFVQIDNVLDQKYATSGTYFETDALSDVGGSPLPANADPRTIVPAAPRAVMAGVRLSW